MRSRRFAFRRLSLVAGLALTGVVVSLVSRPTPAPGQASRRAPDALPIVANGPELSRLAAEFGQEFEARRGAAYRELLKQKFWQDLNADPTRELMGVDERGEPIVYKTHNTDARWTTNTNDLVPGGSSGHNVTGATIGAGELAIWDGDPVRAGHQEFEGRVTKINTSGNGDHATHVAGTMVGAGYSTNTSAQGMAPDALLDSYDWTNDDSEMATAAAAGLQVSNHSYGGVYGYDKDSGGNWHWYGGGGNNEDMDFGLYDSGARAWDVIAKNAPEYLMVVSAGNDRNAEPGSGESHTHAGSGSHTDTHEKDCAGGYDCMGGSALAKNVLTVGAVKDLGFYGYTGDPADVVIESYSSRGPADDGRIKPDIVGNGQDLWSASNASNSAYATKSGTSMAAPNVSGTLALLTEIYEETWGKRPLSSTLKGLVIHTANEAGSTDGPDHIFGWGLLDAHAAADHIDFNTSADYGFAELTLQQGETQVFNFTGDGSEIKVTAVWTDWAGSYSSSDPLPPAVNNGTTPVLNNDLDIRLRRTDIAGADKLPWRLDTANPTAGANRGDNSVDNVEQIHPGNHPSGDWEVRISHKGTLQGGPQTYTLLWTGLELEDELEPTPVGQEFEKPYSTLYSFLLPNTKPGMVVETTKDIHLTHLTIPLQKVCPSDVTITFYEWNGSLRLNRFQTTVSDFYPGMHRYTIPIGFTLDACTRYTIQLDTGPVARWQGYLETDLTLPHRGDHGLVLIEADENFALSAVRIPAFDLHGYAPGVGTTDLGDGISFSGANSTSGSRSLYITAESSLDLSRVEWNAMVNGDQDITANLYDYSGGSRGAKLASGTIEALTGSSPQVVPLSHMLLEGQRYEIRFVYTDVTYQANPGGAVPYTAGAIRVDGFDLLLMDVMLHHEPGVGGDGSTAWYLGTDFLDMSPASPSFTLGVFSTIWKTGYVHGLGVYADVASGSSITFSIYDANGSSRGALIDQVTIQADQSGMRWHDAPFLARVIDGSDYEFTVDFSGVNELRVWNENDALPASPTSFHDLYDASLNQVAVPYLRISHCGVSATLAADPPELPEPGLRLMGASSNPLRGAGSVRFSLEEPSEVTLEVIDVQGRRVKRLLDGVLQPAGEGAVSIDTRDLASGMYFLTLRAGGETRVRKLAVVH